MKHNTIIDSSSPATGGPASSHGDADTPSASPGAAPIRLRLGAAVSASDGPFGELVDLVVDPVERSVTHLVVDPRDGFREARLVPIDLASVGPTGEIDLATTIEHALEFDQVSFVEYLRLGEPIDIGEEWDIGHEHVLSQPYWSGPLMMSPVPWTGQGLVRFDRVPKGECEIRRESVVLDRSERHAGHVEGLIVDGHDIAAVVVRVSTLGLRHFIAVPLDVVGLVDTDRVTLTVDRSELDQLPRVSHELAPPGSHLPSPLEAQLGDLARRGAGRLSGVRRWIRAATGSSRNHPTQHPLAEHPAAEQSPVNTSKERNPL